MKIPFYFIPVFVVILLISSCKKDTIEPPFDEVLYKPYSTGIIKLQYEIPTRRNGMSAIKDTIALFTSIGNNPSQKDDYGYSQPATPWVQLHRLNPNDFQNRTFIFFSGTRLNSLTLPYTFKKGYTRDAQINYTIGLRPYLDSNGNLVNGTNTYAASTYSDNFELTIISGVNNRLQGTFSGVIKNQDGLIIMVKKGLFDIEIVDK